MDTTSKEYYESLIRNYRMYSRGRSIEQYCRDEAVDIKWFEKAQAQYGTPADKPQKKSTRKTKADPTDLIRLHFDDDTAAIQVAANEVNKTDDTNDSMETERKWTVTSLRITSPMGNEIEITASTPSAVTELLTKLAV